MHSFNIKRIFQDYFKNNQTIENDRVVLCVYDPYVDNIFPHFTKRDWSMIFTDVDEEDFKEMGEFYIDRIILIANEKKSNIPFGFICIQESHDTPMEVFIHGGTWEHNTKQILLEYSATDLILQFLIDNNFDVKATCFLTNDKADRFQKSLGFVEYKCDEQLSYKQLRLANYYNNVVRKRKVNGEI